MEEFEMKQLFLLDNKVYEFDEEDKSIAVGTMLYDVRKNTFVKIDTKEGLADYSYLAPEMYIILHEYGKVN